MVTFSLKDAQSGVKVSEQKATPIIMTYFFSGTRLKLGIGESILPKDWNQRTRRARVSAMSAAKLNKYLDNLAQKVKDTHLDMKAEFVQVTPQSLKDALVKDLKTNGNQETLVRFFDRYIEEKEPIRKKGSLDVYRSCAKLLKSYPGSKNWNDIGPKWFEKYQSYLEHEGLSANYIGKNISTIKEIMTLAKAEKLHRNESYLDRSYRPPHEDSQSIFLTYDELLKMYGITLPPGLNRVRNRSMISAFTCLRFSDSSKINLDDIRNGLIYDRNIKTGKNVVLPIHWVVKQIMEDHPDGLPPGISNQKTNDALKEIARRAWINDKVVVSKTRGGKVVTETVEKWKLVTTHTMRRSGATNMLLSGVPKEQVKKAGGWSTDKSFDSYNKVTQEMNARILQSHEFFQEL